MNNTQSLVQNFFSKLTERNLDELVALFSENVDWYIPGDETKAPWLGRRNSRQDVATFYTLLWSQTEPVSAAIDCLLTDDENAVVTGEFSTRMLATGKMVESLFCIQMKFQDGLITKYRLLEDSYAVSVAMTK